MAIIAVSTAPQPYLEENADVWAQIVAKYDLRLRNLRELVGQGDQHADFAFAYGQAYPRGRRETAIVQARAHQRWI